MDKIYRISNEDLIELNSKLKELEIICNRNRIPFFFTAAIANTNDKTEYISLRTDEESVDENEFRATAKIPTLEESNDIETKYLTRSLSPSVYGFDLKTNHFPDFINVLNGFKTFYPIKETEDKDYGDIISDVMKLSDTGSEYVLDEYDFDNEEINEDDVLREGVYEHEEDSKE